MSSVAELPSRSPFSAARDTSGKHRHLPVLPSTMSPSNPPHSDPMDITPTTTAATAPPAQTSAEGGSSGAQNNNTNPNTNASVNSNTNANASANSNGSSETPSANSSSTTTTGPNQTIGAAAAAQQPKVVQTAFIHKLYKYGSPLAPMLGIYR